jgi:hypothetical protein
MKNRLTALSLVTFGVMVFVSPAQAQRSGGFTAAHASRPGMPISRGGVPRNGGHLRHGRRFFDGSTFAWPFYADYDSDLLTTSSAPPEFVVQAPESASPAAAPKPGDSLVLELQGDHWVRITNNGQSQTGDSIQPQPERASHPTTAVPPAVPRRTEATEPPNNLPPAVLVFRDGHEEEIGKYVISGTVIYTSADRWSSGSWTRKVQIAALNVPATLKVNQERGAKFTLPSGPNEVMIRP